MLSPTHEESGYGGHASAAKPGPKNRHLDNAAISVKPNRVLGERTYAPLRARIPVRQALSNWPLENGQIFGTEAGSGKYQIEGTCRKCSPRDSNAHTITRAADSTQEQDTDSKDVHQPSMWKKIILRMPNTRFKMVQVKNLRGKG